MLNYLWAFGITVIIEGTIIYFIYHKKDLVIHSFWLNLLTNPLLNYLLALLTYKYGLPYYPLLIIGEIIVVFIEAGGYTYLRDLPFKNSLILSGVLNISSWGLGSLIVSLINGGVQ